MGFVAGRTVTPGQTGSLMTVSGQQTANAGQDVNPA